MTPAEQKARETGPCWGDGIVAPKQCDESYLCELHGRFAQALTEFAEERVKEARKNCLEAYHCCCAKTKSGVQQARKEGYADGLGDLSKEVTKAVHSGAESMRERCANAALMTYKYDADPMGSRRELDCSQRIADAIRSLPLVEGEK